MSRPIQSLSSRVCLTTVCPRCRTCCREFTAHSCGARTNTDPEPARSVGLGDATPPCAPAHSQQPNGQRHRPAQRWVMTPTSPASTSTKDFQTTSSHHLRVRCLSCAQTELHSPSTISTRPPRSLKIVLSEGARKLSRGPPPCSGASVRRSDLVSHSSSNRHGCSCRSVLVEIYRYCACVDFPSQNITQKITVS